MDLGEKIEKETKMIMVISLRHSKLSSSNVPKVLSGNNYEVKCFYLVDLTDGDLTVDVLEEEVCGSLKVSSGYFPIFSEADISNNIRAIHHVLR